MNDRILKLMAEAGFDVEKLRMYPGGWPREDLLILQDFAQLIVKEVFDCIANEGFEVYGPVTQKVKKHFGVEE
jgi:hypothetical protein